MPEGDGVAAGAIAGVTAAGGVEGSGPSDARAFPLSDFRDIAFEAKSIPRPDAVACDRSHEGMVG